MPTKMSRGRPRTNTNNVNIDEILVEFLSEKETDYGNVCYFKIIDNEWRKNKKKKHNFFRRRGFKSAILVNRTR